jgi:hypothetical protein
MQKSMYGILVPSMQYMNSCTYSCIKDGYIENSGTTNRHVLVFVCVVAGTNGMLLTAARPVPSDNHFCARNLLWYILGLLIACFPGEGACPGVVAVDNTRRDGSHVLNILQCFFPLIMASAVAARVVQDIIHRSYVPCMVYKFHCAA